MSNLITNPSAPLSTAGLSDTLRQQIEQLIRQFNTLILLAAPAETSSSPGTPSNGTTHATISADTKSTALPSAAVSTYRIAAETQALISSVESLTALTRRMKEAWVFGELETVGASRDVEARTERVAREIVEGLVRDAAGGEER